MRTVNLFPKEIVKKIELKTALKKIAAATAVAIFLWILVVGGVSLTQRVITQQIEKIETLLADDKFSASAQTASLLREREADWAEADGSGLNKNIPPYYLVAVTDALGSDSTFNEIKMDSAVGRVTIKVQAPGADSPGALMDRLTATKLFAGIDLTELTSDGNTSDFTLEAAMK